MTNNEAMASDSPLDGKMVTPPFENKRQDWALPCHVSLADRRGRNHVDPVNAWTGRGHDVHPNQ
jgi:hypothetical protein